MSLNNFLNKYQKQNGKSSLSSVGSFTSMSTNSLTQKIQSQNSQNTQNSFQKMNFQQGLPSNSSQNYPSQTQRNALLSQDDNRNQSPFMNNQLKFNQQSQNFNTQQNQSFSQLGSNENQDTLNMSMNDNSLLKDSFYIQNPIQHNTGQIQHQNNYSMPYVNLNQSQLILPTIQESIISTFGGELIQQNFNPHQAQIQNHNFNQSSVNFGQQTQLTNYHVQLLKDEIKKSKAEQKLRENALKQELLSEMKDIKQFFKDKVLKDISSNVEKREETQVKYQKHLEEVHQKVEDIVQNVFNFLQDKNSDEKKKQKVSSSDYAQNISDLRQLIIEVREDITQQPKVISNNLTNDLSKTTQKIYTKINQTKRSLKKSVLISINKSNNKKKQK